MATAVAVAPIAPSSGEQLDELHGLAERLDDVIAGLDASRCDSTTALGLLGVFSRVRKTAAVGEALVAARVDECSAHEQTDHRSTAHLLADLGGTTVGKAKETIDTAKRLRECSATEHALRSGAVSIEQAHVVTSAAAVDPSAEAGLLRIAEDESLPTLHHRAREVKQAAENDRMGVYRRQCAARSLKHWIADDGMVCGRFQLPPDAGAMVVNTLEREADRIFRAKRASGDHETHDRYLADALEATVTGRAAGDDAAVAAPRPVEAVTMRSACTILRMLGDASGDSSPRFTSRQRDASPSTTATRRSSAGHRSLHTGAQDCAC